MGVNTVEGRDTTISLISGAEKKVKYPGDNDSNFLVNLCGCEKHCTCRKSCYGELRSCDSTAKFANGAAMADAANVEIIEIGKGHPAIDVNNKLLDPNAVREGPGRLEGCRALEAKDEMTGPCEVLAWYGDHFPSTMPLPRTWPAWTPTAAAYRALCRATTATHGIPSTRSRVSPSGGRPARALVAQRQPPGATTTVLAHLRSAVSAPLGLPVAPMCLATSWRRWRTRNLR
jgi:hypothetical protein